MSKQANKTKAFWTGFFRAFDITGALRSPPKTFPIRSIKEALKSDWQAVGNDLRSAMKSDPFKKISSK